MIKYILFLLLLPIVSFSQTTIQGEDFSGASGDVHVVGSVLGYISIGEYAQWDLTGMEAGLHKFTWRISCPNSGEEVDIKIDGFTVAHFTVPNTGSFATFTDLDVDIDIPTSGDVQIRWQSIGPAYGPDIDYFIYEKYNLPSVDIGSRTSTVFGILPGNFGSKSLHASVINEPGNSVSSYTWSKISGVGGSIIGQGTADVNITGLGHGLHIYMIDVLDNDGNHGYDTVDISVRFCEGAGNRYTILPYSDSADMYLSDPTFSYNIYSYPDFPVHPLPGDTIAFSGDSTWGLFEMLGYKGSPGCPIVLTNSDTTNPTRFKRGIQMFSCEYIKVTGAKKTTVLNTKPNPSGYWGLIFSNFGILNERHIQINGRSKNIEIEHIKSNGSYSIVEAKHDQPQDFEITGADTMYQYPNWIMDSISITHIYAINCFKDGIYAGNTDPLGQREILQNGELVTGVIPIRLANFSMKYCWIVNTGRTIAQLSGAETGYNEVAYNWFEGGGYELNQSQGNGFSIGGMSRNVYLHNNVITNTFLYGVFDLGSDSNHIYENRIDSSGYIPADTLSTFYPDWMDLDSLDAARVDIEILTISGEKFIKNINADMVYNITSSPDSTVPYYTKWTRFMNNTLGVHTASYNIGFVDWKGHREDWRTNIPVCGNKQKDGTAATMWRPSYLSNPEWPIISTDCSFWIPAIKNFTNKWKYKYNKN